LRGRGFFPEENPKKVAALLTQAKKYSAGRTSALRARIDWSAVGDFSRKVLQETVKIPPGKIRTYGEIAARIGCPGAGRAVGNALAKNPFPLWVPCHRVIRSDGSLGGFGGGSTGGIKLKKRLLELEGAR
jgi:methylated-DNA-[protein]-cysteine S-methyltransferase